MVDEKAKMVRAREIVELIIEGQDPFSGAEIDPDSFLNDPRMIRCLHFISGVLHQNITGGTIKAKPKQVDFYITEEEEARILFPEGPLGISSICKLINEQVELDTRKKLTAVKVNNQLKKMGILTTLQDTEGKNRTGVTQEGKKYGISEITVTFNGRDVQKVVYDEVGKQYLLVNLQKILDFETAE